METFGSVARRTNGTAVVSVRGQVDVYTADRLWETVDEALAGAPSELIVDLSRVTFIDSTGLSVLVRAHKRLKSMRASVVVRGASNQVVKVLEITKLNKVLSLEA